MRVGGHELTMDGDRECAAFEGPTGKVLEHSDSEGGLSKTDSACLALMNDVSRHSECASSLVLSTSFPCLLR